MFSSAVDLYDAPPAWWETDCVRYGWVEASSAGLLESNLLINRHRISYTPVRSRLTSLMGSHVVRLTDCGYMTRLASRLQEDYEVRQRARIERRKLRATSVVPELRELLPESLLKTTRRRRPCAPKFHAGAAKLCKQLPQLLLADDPKLHVGILNA
ncbi:uncharacterized protein [Temnothorax nylanderi]|uniref:uncharacterized protein n=1 Tax=Temnothorax nylanderi TaxID=102681 RepID=UPI003A83D519